jgi:hypothetical protein
VIAFARACPTGGPHLEVSESERVAAQGFQAAVDGFGRPVGGVVVKERQDVVTSACQGAASENRVSERLAILQ